MKTFTDDEMNALLPAAKPYSVVILRQGTKHSDDTAPPIIWEHGRRNFALRHDGVLAVVLPVTDDSEGMRRRGVHRDRRRHHRGDERRPRRASRVFTFEVHPCRGFPGDALP